MPTLHPVYRTIVMLSAMGWLISNSPPVWAQSQSAPGSSSSSGAALEWQALPPIPDELGVAGPLVGVHNDFLVVGCGANFAKPVWENTKRWQKAIYLLDLRHPARGWKAIGDWSGHSGYAACASTPYGIIVIGGNNQTGEFKDCWLLKVDRNDESELGMSAERLADLPEKVVYGQALWIIDRVVVGSGQTNSDLSSALAGGWQLKLGEQFRIPGASWRPLPDCPGGPRSLAMLAALPGQAQRSKLLLMGGRRQVGKRVQFLSDVWQFDIFEQSWERRADLPVALAAGAAGPIGNYVAVVSGDDGRLFTQTDQLKDKHPGFAKRTWLLDVATNRWSEGAASPINQVTTPPVAFGEHLIIASGEIRPRVRTPQVWKIGPPAVQP